MVSSRRRAHREQGLEWKFPETLSDLFDQKVGVRQKLKLLILVVKDHAKDIGHTAVNQSSQNWAPFSYLTLYCPIVNENCGPKRVTHHMFYSVQKIAVVQRKKRVVLTLPHRISNPKSLISLQPTKAFMRLS